MQTVQGAAKTQEAATAPAAGSDKGRVLVSVSDKAELIPFVQVGHGSFGWSLAAWLGTARHPSMGPTRNLSGASTTP